MKILLIVFGFFLCGAAVSQQKPNVIIILADDLGYADVGFTGCKDIPTPNIDRIANQGVVFTNGYVTYPVCGPSRAGLITGRYQNRFGFARNPIIAPNDPNMGLPLSERTLATELKTAGYTNAIIGKWHLGAHETLKPDRRGFDYFYGFLSGGHRYFPEEYIYNDLSEVTRDWDWYRTKLLRNNKPVEETEYLTDALSREAVGFIEQNQENPFFLYLSYNAPHAPLQATEKYLSRFDHIQDEKRRTYAAMVSAMDDGIGIVLESLKTNGILDNTIVAFLSDNGGPEYANGSDNGQLREGKGSMFEGGVRVPFTLMWPDKITPGQYHLPVISMDLFAIASTYAGVTPQNNIDGVNLVPYINGEVSGSPHPTLMWVNVDKNSYGVRSGSHKLVNEATSSNSLYDLSDDISEQSPIDNSLLSDDMLRTYNNWRNEHSEPLFLGLEQRGAYKRK